MNRAYQFPGRIYFIACLPMNAVKIGFTKGAPEARLLALQTGCPAPLKLYGHVPGTLEEEGKLHAAFRSLHIQGEWFRFEGKLHHMACFLTGKADRDSFHAALHDVLMQGIWHPNDPLSCDEYGDTGNWEPFRALLWEHYGPWGD